jgi:hypothetical protein
MKLHSLIREIKGLSSIRRGVLALLLLIIISTIICWRFFISPPLRNIKDINKYLAKLDSPNYLVMMAACDECSLQFDIFAEQFSKLGFKSDLHDKYRWSFIGVLDRGKVIHEDLQDALILYEGLIGSKSVKVLSAGCEKGNKASVFFDGLQYKLMCRGLNIVVFDYSKNKIVDCVDFDTYANPILSYRYYINEVDIKLSICCFSVVFIVFFLSYNFPVFKKVKIFRNIFMKCQLLFASVEINMVNIAFSIFIGLFVQLVLASLGFLVHVGLNLFYPIIGLITIFSILIYLDTKSSKKCWIDVIAVLMIIVTSYILASYIPDFNGDGLMYHSPGIWLFMNGWNPVNETSKSFMKNLYPMIEACGSNTWITWYPKASELSSALINFPFWSMEAGKSINMLFCIVLFCYSFFVFVRMKISKILSLLFSFLIVLTPVTLVQMFSYYVDLNVYFLSMLVLFAILSMEVSEKKNLGFIMIITSTIFASGVKILGFIYSGIFLSAYFMYLFGQKDT